MKFGMNNALCHLAGDYLLQSNWMAQNKTKSHRAALAHALCYSLPFLLNRPSKKGYALLVASHFLIDRYRLARYTVWSKDWLAPRGQKHHLTATGMQDDVPQWMSVWLMIIADNTIHMIINEQAMKL